MKLMRRPLRAGTAAALSALVAASAIAAMTPAQALSPTGVGPSNPAARGFPAYYTDESTPGVPLQLCIDGSAACGGATLTSDGAGGPGLGLPPDGEGFYYMASTTLTAPGIDIDVEFAAEAAWLDRTTNITFDRVRIRGHADAAGAIPVNTPYGTFNVTATDPANVRNVNFTEDIGCAIAPCDFNLMATDPGGHITSWITSTTPPAGYLGDGVTAEAATVAGAPATLSVGVDSTDKWIVEGKIAKANAVSVPNTLDFGNVGKATTKSVTMSNLGTAPRTISTVALTGDKSITMLPSSTCKSGTALAVGAKCQVDLRYAPGAAKSAAATLTITDNVGATTVKVSARTASELKAPTAVQFKAVRSGARGATRRIVVTNTGSQPLKISGVSLGGRNATSFGIRSGAPKVCVRGATVAPGKQCAAYVGFQPKGFGPKQASLLIRSNALGGVRSVTLRGTAR
jgi:hypothetical protein